MIGRYNGGKRAGHERERPLLRRLEYLRKLDSKVMQLNFDINASFGGYVNAHIIDNQLNQPIL